jgi:hypothetical protein
MAARTAPPAVNRTEPVHISTLENNAATTAPPVVNRTEPVHISTLDDKARRDLYAEMMQQDNPMFGAISRDYVLAPEPANDNDGTCAAEEAPHTGEKRKYNCITQKGSSREEIYLGQFQGRLCLWETGSKLNWIARQDGYPTPEDALFAARALNKACEAWNKALGGRLEFVYTDVFYDACFQLRYGDDMGDVLARAFFPDDYKKTLNDLYVYERAFQPDQKGFMANTFAHELGHVLGLRHEHGLGGVVGCWTQGPPEDVDEGDDESGRILGSVLFGTRNPKSVMSYYQGMWIQQSDADALNLALDTLTDGKEIKGGGVKNTVVSKMVKRVKPEN